MAKQVNIKIGADSKEAESGLKKVTSDLNKLSKEIKKSDVSKFAKSFTGVTAAAGGALVAIKKINDTVKETTELYKKQATAEKQLEIAAQNNPYLNARSVEALKNYASELQSISIVGDETLIPLMAQLVTSGRTQAEIQEIMAAALDVSASGIMSLDSAVTQLNKTYSGSVGLLGNQISELKTLTTEQLKNGDAVKIVADKFKGMAEETAKATGSSEQLKNALGDLKEEVGAGFEKGLAPMRRYFTELISGWTNAKKAAREYKEAAGKVEDGTANTIDYEKVIAEEEKQAAYYQKQVQETMALLNDKEALNQKIKDARGYISEATFKTALKNQQAQYELHTQQVNQLKEEYKVQKDLEDAKSKADAEAQAQAEAKAEENERNKKALEIMQKNEDALNKALEQQRIRAELNGKEIDGQEKLNILMDSYVSLVTTSGLVTENNPYAQKRLEEIKAYALELAGVVETTEETTKEVEKEVTALDKLKNVLEEIGKLNGNLTQLKDYMAQFGDIVNGVTELQIQANQNETDAQLSALEDSYDNGLLSYEEYCSKKKEIQKKQAQEEYKLQMWQWTSSMLTATANIAQGISAALAQTPPASYVMAALTAAAGAVQIATLTANRPTPPAFANGGYVGGANGATMGPDNTVGTLRSGELVLNANQQKSLWNLINSGNSAGGAVVNMPVTIQNNSSAHVSTQLNKNGLIVMVDEIVNSSMQAGKYNNSMNIAQQLQNGNTYL